MIRDDTHLQFLQLTVLQFSENKSLGVIDQSLWHNVSLSKYCYLMNLCNFGFKSSCLE